MAMQGPPPPAKGMSPQDYYNALISQGMRPWQAYQAVQASYGPPKTPEQQAKDQASAQQNAAIGQTVGMVAGLIGTRYVLNNAGTWIDKLTGNPAPPNVVSAIRTSQAGGAASTTAGVASNTPSTPEIASAKTVTIDTPVGKQNVPESLANDSEFLSSVNWEAIGSGAMSLLAAYQAYQSYKSGDKVGAGISGGAAITSGAAAANASGAGFAGSETLGAAAPYLGAAAGLYQGYKTAEMIGDTAAGSQRTQQGALGGAASGAMIGGTFAGPWGAVIGAAVGGLAGAVGSWTGSHKGKAQFTRDKIRGVLQEGGILNDKYQGTLADGSTYDFGKDGKSLKWKEIDKVAAAQPSAWNAAVPITDAMAAAYGFVGQKASDIAAWYAKGAVSNAGNDPRIAIANAQHFAQQQGITYDLVKQKLDEAMADNRLSKSQYDYYMSGASQLNTGTPSQSSNQPGPQTRPPAPLPQGTPNQIPQPTKKESMGDVLRRFAKK